MATNALYIYSNEQSIVLDPTPLVSISATHLRDHQRSYGEEYDITLTGYIMSSGLASGTFNPPTQSGGGTNVRAVFEGQERLRDYFSHEKLRFELNDLSGTCIATYFPVLQNLDFEEGSYFQYCRFTANFKAYDKWVGSNPAPPIDAANIAEFPTIGNPVVVSNLTEDVSIEPVIGEYGYYYHTGTDGQHYPITNRHYKYTRTLQATGKPIIPEANYSGIVGKNGPVTGEEIQQNIDTSKSSMLAKSFLKSYIDAKCNPQSLKLTIADKIAQYENHLENSPNTWWELYNWERSEQDNVSEGSYTITDTFIIAPTDSLAIETFNHNLTTGQDSPYHKITIDGTIKGLSRWIPEQYGSGITETENRTTLSSLEGGESDKAKSAYAKLSRNGQFGEPSTFYKRCNALSGLRLNSQPVSVALGTNPLTGEITYNIEFDSRPTNFFSRVISERIEVTDTYPGDVFATIPILGRPTGPVLQYTYGRTEFKRDLSIEVILDQTWIGYGRSNNLSDSVLRQNMLYSKPSLLHPFRGELDTIIGIYSPANEPGIRRYFQNAPTETWNAVEGRYTLNLSWVYELSE